MASSASFWFAASFLIPLVISFVLLDLEVLNPSALRGLALVHAALVVVGVIRIIQRFPTHRFKPLEIIMASVVLAAIVFSIWHAHSEYRHEGAHDQGVYREMALWYGASGSLPFPATSASHPGFFLASGNVQAQFFPGFSLFLATFVAWFGPLGIRLACCWLAGLVFLGIWNTFIRPCGAWWGLAAGIAFFVIPNVFYFWLATYSELLQMAIVAWIFSALSDLRDVKLHTSALISIPLLVWADALVRQDALLLFPAALLALVFLLADALRNRDYGTRQRAAIMSFSLLVPVVAAVQVGVAALSNDAILEHFFRPFIGISQGGIGGDSESSGFLETSMVAAAFFAAAWLPLLPLVSLAAGGTLLGIKGSEGPNRAQFVLAALVMLPFTVLVIRPFVALYLPWAFRRYLSVLVLGAVVMATVSASKIWNALPRASTRIPVIAIFVATLSIYGVVTLPIAIQPEGSGLDHTLRELGRELPPNSLVIAADRFATESFVPQLQYLGHANVLYDQGAVLRNETYAWFLSDADHVFFITTRTAKQGIAHPAFEKDSATWISAYAVSFKAIPTYCDVRPVQDSPASAESAARLFEQCAGMEGPRLAERELTFNIFELSAEAKQAFVGRYNSTSEVLALEPQFQR
jgi:hypothetical protein